ncbi:hypothetical protein TUM17383_15280 [Shewanella algae]|nr:hypothetical protein TUM17383_15280 [Shewanella algae]
MGYQSLGSGDSRAGHIALGQGIVQCFPGGQIIGGQANETPIGTLGCQ